MKKFTLLLIICFFLCHCSSQSPSNSQAQVSNIPTKNFMVGKWKGFVWKAGEFTEPYMFITFKEDGKVIYDYLAANDSKYQNMEATYKVIGENIINFGEKETDESKMKVVRKAPNRMQLHYNNEKMIENIDVAMITQCEFIRVEE